MNQEHTHKRAAATFFVAFFGIVVLAISGVTTFSFFSTYFIDIFPTDFLGRELAAMLAGGAGICLFDLAAVYWLNTFLNHAQTAEQRGIALVMLVFAFIGAAGASVAQLGLAASGDVALDAGTRQTIANLAVWTVIAGVVANFGANIAYGRYSLESKASVMEADRRDMLQAAENEQARLLDSQIKQQVKTLLTNASAKLARMQAERIAAEFMRREQSKYNPAGADNNGAGESDTAPLPNQVPWGVFDEEGTMYLGPITEEGARDTVRIWNGDMGREKYVAKCLLPAPDQPLAPEQPPAAGPNGRGTPRPFPFE